MSEKRSPVLTVAAVSAWHKEVASLGFQGRLRKLNSNQDDPFCDVNIKTVDKSSDTFQTFRAHKLVLQVCSRKLAEELCTCPAILVHESSESRAYYHLDVDSVDPIIMKHVLKFMYTGDIDGELPWEILGGLIQASDYLGMPDLQDLVVSIFEDGHNCEQVVARFVKLSKIESSSVVFPVEYYVGLIKLCLFYMLRNAEVVLRSKEFLELSYEQLDQLFASNFLICEEMTVYKNLNRWAKHACKESGLDSSDIKNRRQVIALRGTDKLGLLRHIRFATIDEAEFGNATRDPSRSLLPRDAREAVNLYHALNEPTKLFIDKTRIPDITEGNLDDFCDHVNELVKQFIPNALSRSTEIPDTSENTPTQKTQLSADANVSDFKIEEQSPKEVSTFSIKHENIQIPVGSPELENSFMPKLDVEGIKVQKTPLRDSQSSSKTPKIDRATVVIKGKRKKSTIKKDGATPKKISRSSHVRNLSKYEPVSGASADIENKPETPKLMTNIEGAQSSIKNQHTYNVTSKVLSFSDVIRECKGMPTLKQVILGDIKLVSKNSRKSLVPFVYLPQLQEYCLGINITPDMLKTFKNVISFLENTRLDDYIFFYTSNDQPGSNRFHNLWGTTDITISFNGVKVLFLNPRCVTLNFTKNDLFEVVSAENLKSISVLNIANCSVPPNLLIEDVLGNVEEIRMVCVKGILANTVLQRCSALKKFAVWPITCSTPTICLDDISSEDLNSFSISGHMIKVKMYGTIGMRSFPAVENLCFNDCSWDPMLISHLGMYFPNIRRVGIISQFSPVSPNMLQNIVNLSSVEDVLIWNFDPKSLGNNVESEPNLKLLLQTLKPKSSQNEINFRLEKSTTSRWTAHAVSKEDLKMFLFQSFGFASFYERDAWLKHFWASVDCF